MQLLITLWVKIDKPATQIVNTTHLNDIVIQVRWL